jgi:hypothetical protein
LPGHGRAAQHWSSGELHTVAFTGGTWQTVNPPGVTGTQAPPGQSASVWQSPGSGSPASPPALVLVEELALLAEVALLLDEALVLVLLDELLVLVAPELLDEDDEVPAPPAPPVPRAPPPPPQPRTKRARRKEGVR